MIHAVALAESFFAVGVACAVIFPRHANDTGFFGGKLSRPFRAMLFAVVCSNLTITLLFPDFGLRRAHKEPTSAGHVSVLFLAAFESLVFNFLCFLMPYLLQVRLREKINVRPAKNLLPWLHAVIALSMAGVLLGIFVGPRYWSIKKVADGLCSLPVLQTVRIHERVHGRDMPSQTLTVLECFSLVAAVMGGVGYGMKETTIHSSYQAQQTYEILEGVRLLGRFAKWTRLLFHSLLLNIADGAAQGFDGAGVNGEKTLESQSFCALEEGSASSLTATLVSRHKGKNDR